MSDNPEFENSVRRTLRATLAGVTPPEQLDEVVDLAVHAAFEAERKLEAICAAASNKGVHLAALGPAWSLMTILAETRREMIRAACAETGISVLQLPAAPAP